MAEIFDFFNTDANNVGRWPEGMFGSTINNAGRADEGILARWYHDTDGSLTASGAANAFTLTSNRVISALFNNLVMAWTANFSITGSATLNLNGLGAKTIKRFNGQDLASGDILSGQPLIVVYKSSPDVWFMMTAPAALTNNMFVDFSANTPANPAPGIARLYARVISGLAEPRLVYRDTFGSEIALLGPPARAYAEYTLNNPHTAIIPFDDTPPQNTEGTQILSAAITLKRDSSRVRARFRAWGFCIGSGGDNPQSWVAALFISTSASALDAARAGRDLGGSLSGGGNTQGTLEFEHAPGSVGPHTYTINVGPIQADSTVRLNGDSSSHRFGAASHATLVLEEVFV